MEVVMHPNEGPRPFEARKIYLQLGPDRSLSQVAKQLNKSVGLIARWSTTWGWVEDARQYDAAMATEEANAQAKERSRIARRLERARVSQPDHELNLAERMQTRAQDLLNLPHVKRKTIGDQGETITLVPANAQEFRAAKELAVASSDLARRALGMPKERTDNVHSLGDADLINLIASMVGADPSEGETDVRESKQDAAQDTSNSAARGATPGADNPTDCNGATDVEVFEVYPDDPDDDDSARPDNMD